jgi:hypothetical protein
MRRGGRVKSEPLMPFVWRLPRGDNLASLLTQEPDTAKWVSSLVVVRGVTKRDQAEVVGNRGSTRIANKFDRSVGQIDVAQFASQGRRARIVKHKELGGRSSLDLITYVRRELRIAKLNQLKGNEPLSGNDTSNIGLRRRSILHCRGVDRQSRAFDEFTKDAHFSRGLFRLGVVSVTQLSYSQSEI